MRKRRSYFGVTGFSKPFEVSCALELMPETHRQFMMGVVATAGSIYGHAPSEPYRNIVPRNEMMSSLMSPNTRFLNLVHYSSRKRNVEHLCDDLMRLHRVCGKNLDGFQLNFDWPSFKELERYRIIAGRRPYIVLQISPMAIDQANGTPAGVARRLRGYDGLIDAILFDLSVGEGVPLDASRALPFLEAIESACTVDLGAAGGLGPETMHLIDPLLERYPQLNFDAQKNLHVPGGGISVSALRAFMQEAPRHYVEMQSVAV